MDAARREKKEHGTLAFPFQIYPALDGSEADDSDFIPYHWHPELEIITVDSGRVSLTIADHIYEGVHGDVFFAAGEELHEIRAAGRENQFRSFVFPVDFLQFARGDLTEIELLRPLAEGRLRFATCLRAGAPGQREVRTLLEQIVQSGKKLVIISDSLRCAGMPDGQYELGGQPIEMKNGRATLLGTDTLAGSSSNLLSELQNVVAFGLPLEDAVTALTLAPARAVRLDHQIGSLAVGKQADLVLLNPDLTLDSVYVDGEKVR